MTEPGPPDARPDPATDDPASPSIDSDDLAGALVARPPENDDAPDEDATDDAAEEGAPAGPPRPGLRTFSLEHRAAPGLYLVGWLACLLGSGIFTVSLLSEPSGGRTVLLVVGLVLLSVGLIAAAGQQALERRAGPAIGYTGPSPFLVFSAVVPISLLLLLAFAVILEVVGLGSDSAVGIVVGGLATAIPFVGLVRLLVVGTGALSWVDMGFLRRRPELIVDVADGLVWGVILVVGTGILAIALSALLPQPPGPLPEATTVAERVAVLLVGVVIAPISEEIFFRGFATTAWARTMSPLATIVRSGIFFAFIHILTVGGATTFEQGLGFAAFAFLGRIPISIALAAMFLRRRSIYASLALHATFNALPLLALMAG